MASDKPAPAEEPKAARPPAPKPPEPVFKSTPDPEPRPAPKDMADLSDAAVVHELRKQGRAFRVIANRDVQSQGLVEAGSEEEACAKYAAGRPGSTPADFRAEKLVP